MKKLIISLALALTMVSLIAAPAFAVPGGPITFDKYDVGTYITDQYQNDGIIFGGDDPHIENDGAHPTTTVLSGSPQYQGDITGTRY